MTVNDNPGPGPAPVETGGPGRPARVGLGKRLRTYFLAGILVTAPISITVVLTWEFISFVDRGVKPLIPHSYNPETYLPFAMPGLGVVVAFVAMVVIGALATNFLGRSVQALGERLLDNVPVVRTIYKTVKQIFETVFSQQSNAFREAVLLEYPRRDAWTIGFITGATKGEVKSKLPDDMVNVYVPTTPNPTSGFLLFVPRRDLTPLAMTVEEAIRMVISCGLVAPAEAHPHRRRKAPATSAGAEQADG